MQGRTISAVLLATAALALPSSQTAHAAQTPSWTAAALKCPQDYVCIANSTAQANYLYRDAFSSPQYNRTADRGTPIATVATNHTRFAIRTKGKSGATWCLNPGESHRYAAGFVEFWVYPSSTCPPK
jgi:hypothetical protein